MKIIKDFSNWDEQDEILGLPRPMVHVPEKFRKEADYFINKNIPIPWQSKPILKNNAMFNVITKNEKKVKPDNICGYCGLSFLPEEICISWNSEKTEDGRCYKDGLINDEKGPRVFSDIMPFHIECMKQARIFCPFMKKRKDFEFEQGKFKHIKANADYLLLKIKEKNDN